MIEKNFEGVSVRWVIALKGEAEEIIKKVKELYLGISKEGRKNFRDVLKEEGKKKKTN